MLRRILKFNLQQQIKSLHVLLNFLDTKSDHFPNEDQENLTHLKSYCRKNLQWLKEVHFEMYEA